jgi:hypothetical protein
LCTRWPFVRADAAGRLVRHDQSSPGENRSVQSRWITNSSLPRARRTAMSPLADHLIKAARNTTKYLIARLLGGYLRKWMFSPTAPYASARTITPHDAPGLRFRDTSIDACLVAVGAFYQTRREPLSLHFRKCRFLSVRERRRCRRRNPKHRQSHLYFLKVQHYGSSLQSAKWNKRIERATALHQFTFLTCQHGQRVGAVRNGVRPRGADTASRS